MSKSMLHITFILSLAILLTSCKRETERTAAPVTVAVADVSMTDQSIAKVKELYEKARQAGDTVPEDVMVWAKADAEKIGDWEYQVMTVTQQTDAELQIQLETWGTNRWECFWVEPTADGRRFYFKKPARSYLKLAGQAAKFVPLPSGGEQ